MTNPVKAVRIDDLDDIPNPAPGSFEYVCSPENDIVGMIYICPCGCGQEGWLGFRPFSERPSWEWDGNKEKPTLQPSVHHIYTRTDTGEKKTHWHGWLTSGEWHSC